MQTGRPGWGGGFAKDATRPLDCGAKEHEGATGGQGNPRMPGLRGEGREREGKVGGGKNRSLSNGTITTGKDPRSSFRNSGLQATVSIPNGCRAG